MIRKSPFAQLALLTVAVVLLFVVFATTGNP